jgi:hypothetical protein
MGHAAHCSAVMPRYIISSQPSSRHFSLPEVDRAGAAGLSLAPASCLPLNGTKRAGAASTAQIGRSPITDR